jgi:KaiC/GvpD/RAD55 family RecA-like ATPase
VNDLVRSVRSGSVGLDLVLGGGPRLLRRGPDPTRESATVLVRGGPGVGKSVFAADFAMRMATALGGDALYVCIEVLPSEVIAQRMGFDGFDPAKPAAVDLAHAGARKAPGDGPKLVVGMADMPVVEGVPDVGSTMLALARLAAERGFAPRVVVVDSLSDGYGLGRNVPRPIVDGVCKLAVEEGWTLVLVEEVAGVETSAWSFAVDTVLTLSVTPAGRREVMVTKHRFGSCQPGPHRLLVEREGVRVLPCFAAYRNAVRDLDLPPPATNRSLRVPVVGPELDWTTFDVPDGHGRLVLLEVGSTEPRFREPVQTIADRVGVAARDGTSEGREGVTLWLGELAVGRFGQPADSLTVGTLHPTIDGEEWLEGVLRRLTATRSPLARVAIGPTDRLAIYEHGGTILKAIHLLAGILTRLGMIAVVYGAGIEGVIPAGTVDEVWALFRAGETSQPDLRLRISRIFDRRANHVDFVTATS